VGSLLDPCLFERHLAGNWAVSLERKIIKCGIPARKDIMKQ
jgi:hypothetical protein